MGLWPPSILCAPEPSAPFPALLSPNFPSRAFSLPWSRTCLILALPNCHMRILAPAQHHLTPEDFHALSDHPETLPLSARTVPAPLCPPWEGEPCSMDALDHPEWLPRWSTCPGAFTVKKHSRCLGWQPASSDSISAFTSRAHANPSPSPLTATTDLPRMPARDLHILSQGFEQLLCFHTLGGLGWSGGWRMPPVCADSQSSKCSASHLSPPSLLLSTFSHAPHQLRALDSLKALPPSLCPMGAQTTAGTRAAHVGSPPLPSSLHHSPTSPFPCHDSHKGHQ